MSDNTPENMLSARERIIEAALYEIATNKISGTTLRQVARRAEISLGTLHYHFPSRAELHLAILDELANMFTQKRESELIDSDLPPSEKLYSFFNQTIQLLREQSYLSAVFLDFWGQGVFDLDIQPRIQGMYNRWREDIQAVVESGVESGVFAAQYAAIVPYIMLSIMEGVTLQYLIDNEALSDLEYYFAASHTMVLQLLGVE
jgi:TetR/AcrR family transcriptional repressor of bet genes